ncbi:hypothetical protein ABEB36_012746 [Hypothenemus hampei]|uniref:Uncharacterized protein n=1 Tax=Hypothenemus hampei TaxID=57062 RepID=A0ABD1ED11_HYPHA
MINFFLNALSKEIKIEDIAAKKIGQECEKDFFYIDSDSDTDEMPTHPKSKTQEIEEVFLKYNTPLPSSAPVERMFSYATITNCPKANRLFDEMFQKRVILKTNLKYDKHMSD